MRHSLAIISPLQLCADEKLLSLSFMPNVVASPAKKEAKEDSMPATVSTPISLNPGLYSTLQALPEMTTLNEYSK